MRRKNFVAIDFETANNKQYSVCEAGICVVSNGKIIEKKSWLVRPYKNEYNWQNIKVHGIRPQDTENASEFPAVWNQINEYLADGLPLVAHNAAFDMNCIRECINFYKMDKQKLDYYCTLRASRHLFDFECNKLDYLCNEFDIDLGTHHRAGDDAESCARLMLKLMEKKGIPDIDGMTFCHGYLYKKRDLKSIFKDLKSLLS